MNQQPDEQRKHRLSELPSALKNPLAWAGGGLGALGAVVLFLLISGVENRVRVIEASLPCDTPEAERTEATESACRQAQRRRIDQTPPALACEMVRKAATVMRVETADGIYAVTVTCD